MNATKIPAFVYLILVILAFITCTSEGYWGNATSLSLILTLPWSISMTVFMWTIAHDGASSLLVFLIPFAALNFFLIYRTDWLKRIWSWWWV